MFSGLGEVILKFGIEGTQGLDQMLMPFPDFMLQWEPTTMSFLALIKLLQIQEAFLP